MQASKYIRPLLALWNETPARTRNYPVPFTGELIAHIDKLALQSRRGRLGRLALFELCNLFFRFYDDLECIEEIGACLKTHMGKYQPNEKIMGLDNIREHLNELISTKGHNFLVTTALKTGQKLEQFDFNFVKLLWRPFLGARAKVSEKIYFFRETPARMVENLKNFQLNLL